jgi:hypothetical protein
VAGFGGTLNWVLSFVFVTAVLALEMGAAYLYLDPFKYLSRDHSPAWLAAAVGLVIVMSSVAAVVPMALGIRAFDRQEF